MGPLRTRKRNLKANLNLKAKTNSGQERSKTGGLTTLCQVDDFALNCRRLRLQASKVSYLPTFLAPSWHGIGEEGTRRDLGDKSWGATLVSSFQYIADREAYTVSRSNYIYSLAQLIKSAKL